MFVFVCVSALERYCSMVMSKAVGQKEEFSDGPGSASLVVEHYDLRGLFQHKWVYDFKFSKKKNFLVSKEPGSNQILCTTSSHCLGTNGFGDAFTGRRQFDRRCCCTAMHHSGNNASLE